MRLKDTREPLAKRAMLEYFFELMVANAQYEQIQQLSSYIGITNSTVQSYKNRNIDTALGFTEPYFIRLCPLLSEKIFDNEDYENLYFNLYEEYYKTHDYHGRNNDLCAAQEIFMILNDSRHGVNIIFEDLYEKLGGMLGMSAEQMSDSQLIYASGDRIAGSPAYKKYINRCRKAMEEVTGEDIVQYFATNYKVLTEGMESFYYNETPGNIAYEVAEMSIERHGGNSTWILGMDFKDFAPFDAKSQTVYHPDINRIIDDFYKCVLINHCGCADGREPITQVWLSREFHRDKAREDIVNIAYAIRIDILCQMLSLLQEAEIKHFSWETYTGRNADDVYRETIKEKDDEINSLEQKYKEALLENSDLRQRLERKTDKETVSFEIAAKDNDKKEEAHAREIGALREQIKIQQDYIELLESREEAGDDEASTVDFGKLESKKYLFIGGAEGQIRNLKQHFPGSFYMTSETDDISNVSADAVVMLIRNMSHKMFFKYKASPNVNSLPVVYCNTRNMENIYSDMYSVVKAM